MKILQINAVCTFGSTGRIAYEMAKEVETYGHEYYLAYSNGAELLRSSTNYKIGGILGKKIHALLARVTGKQGYFSSYSTLKLIRYIKKEKIDIVHLGNLHANYLNLKILLNFLAKENIPTVITLHDCWFYTGKCCHYTVENCDKWQTQCNNCPRKHKDIPSWFFDRSRRMYEDKKHWFGNIKNLAVIGVSDWITDEASKSFFKDIAVIKRIYNWIDTDIFKPISIDKIKELQNKYDLENRFVILSVASGWSDSKGLNKIIELSSMLSDDEVIVLIGMTNLKEKISDNVVCTGHIKNTYELATWYSLADCYVSTSLEESFGLTVAEAQACGTPAVVYNSTASPELIQEGCGYIVDINASATDFYDSIKKVRIKGKAAFGASCIENVKKNFNQQKNIKKYIEVYEEIIKLKKETD